MIFALETTQEHEPVSLASSVEANQKEKPKKSKEKHKVKREHKHKKEKVTKLNKLVLSFFVWIDFLSQMNTTMIYMLDYGKEK